MNKESDLLPPVKHEDSLREIRADLRAAMNGIAARSIRESGMGYRLVYGVELPRLRQIAEGFTPERRLAQTLWQSDVREEKILGILLYPKNEFDADIAHLWIESLLPEQAELAGLMAMELMSMMPDASELAFLLMADERPMHQLCGLLTLTRLMMRGAMLSPDAADEFRDQAESALHANYMPLRKAAQNALARLEENRELEA